jgi:hypothetical protein
MVAASSSNFACRSDLRGSLDVNVPQTDKRDRHLLLFVREPEGKAARFLCGHDEREWFVAAVPGGASSVVQAKEALKPLALRTYQNQLKVPTRLRNRRKNAAFRRQGEWFFVPASVWGRDRSTRSSSFTMSRCAAVRVSPTSWNSFIGSEVKWSILVLATLNRSTKRSIGSSFSGSRTQQPGLGKCCAAIRALRARPHPTPGSCDDHAARLASRRVEHRDGNRNDAQRGVHRLTINKHIERGSGEPLSIQFHRPVAQKQSARLITGRRRSVTCRDDHYSPCASTPE